MEQYFIKGFDDRYSIREDGNVIRHYLIRNDKKVYKDIVVNKYIPNKSVNYCVVLSKPRQEHGKDVLLSKLMIEYFNLKTPDDSHTYKLHFRDNDKSNYSLENIYFDLDIKKDYSFYPKVFHEGRDVISKVCGNCGEHKVINNFRQSKLGYYLHVCKTCWRKFNDKPSRDKAHRIIREQLKNPYINRLLRKEGENPDNYNASMIETKRLIIKIKRENKLQTKNKILCQK